MVEEVRRRRVMPGVDAMAAAPAVLPPDHGAARILAFLQILARSIDWSEYGPSLAAGDVSRLPPALARQIEPVATRLLQSRADALGVDARLLTVALAARIAGETDRAAMRVARMLLGRLPKEAVDALLRELGMRP